MSPQRGQRGVTAGREEGEGLLGGNPEGQGDWGGREDSRGKAPQGDGVTGLRMRSGNLG